LPLRVLRETLRLRDGIGTGWVVWVEDVHDDLAVEPGEGR
jgi:hypothetical protein